MLSAWMLQAGCTISTEELVDEEKLRDPAVLGRSMLGDDPSLVDETQLWEPDLLVSKCWLT